METFEVKILQTRKRLGIKEIEAPSIEEAEIYLLKLLCDFFETRLDSCLKYYRLKSESERKLILLINCNRIAVEIKGN